MSIYQSNTPKLILNSLTGDFHQFPPPRNPYGALYSSVWKKEINVLGRAIYLQFKHVVILRDQQRITDTCWLGILTRAHQGMCTKDDLKEICKLIITKVDCIPPDFNEDPWRDAVLVTPRNAVRTAWNERAMHKLSARTGKTLYIASSEDTIGRSRIPLTTSQRIIVAGTKSEKTGHLAEQIMLSIGMQAMVVLNVATDVDLANGSRGEVTDIVLDPREPFRPNAGDEAHIPTFHGCLSPFQWMSIYISRPSFRTPSNLPK